MAEAAENEILIGKKPLMSYVLAVITQLSSGKNEVKIRARGKAISRAVDVSQIVLNKFVKDAEIVEVKLGTDEIEGQDGNKTNVSTIEIVMRKK